MDIQRQLTVFCEEVTKLDSVFDQPDPITMSIAIEPEIATEVIHSHVAVETTGELTKGMTVVDRLGATGHAPNTQVVLAANRDRFHERVKEACRKSSNPVKRRYASRYRSAVRSTTSAGSSGGASPEWRSQPEASDVSQSRTYCLSKLGWACPGCHSSAGQKREESGVNTSSPSTISPVATSRPNSNLVSAKITPRSRAIDSACW